MIKFVKLQAEMDILTDHGNWNCESEYITQSGFKLDMS